MDIRAGLKTCATPAWTAVLLFWAVALGLAGVGCASSGTMGGVPVPKPFPMPGSATPPGVSDPDNTAGSPAAPPPGAPAPENAIDPRVVAPPVPSTGADAAYALVGTALDLRGSPYRDGGADPRGFDCSGFTQYVFRQHGLTLPRSVRDQFGLGQTVEARDLAPGDLLFFATTDPGVSHVGIAVGTDQFIHAPSSTGVVRVERLSSGYWSQRFLGARRLN